MSVLAFTESLDEQIIFAKGLPCHFVDPDIFFADIPKDVEKAKAICQACPQQVACLVGALERAEPHGVWGGELFSEGVIIARKRLRGRPRKEEKLQSSVDLSTLPVLQKEPSSFAA
ncbi:MAG: WhiB family transcriptional regulator [Propionibacteriaceae bacterium]